MGGTSELLLGSDADAVPRARAFATQWLAGAPEPVVADVKLIVTELVTNALLHGVPPVRLRLCPADDAVRVEVEDLGRRMPVRAQPSAEAMTGRGLALVGALATGWGVAPASGGGKVVWAEVSATDDPAPADDDDIDIDALLAMWNDEPTGVEDTYTVRLGSVPTDLLLAAKSHIDNLVREFTLARAGAEASTHEMPPQLSRLIDVVTARFAAARGDIKRQAIAAAQRGDRETELVLHLPLSAADAGEEYLAALDEADRYARAARILTLETPPVHRVFRRWYVQALVDQLRAFGRGERPAASRTFQEVLADEVDALSALRETWDRLQLLQKVTAELTGAATPEDIATTVVDNAITYLGAVSARIYTVSGDLLRSVATRGGDPDLAARYEEFPISADLPGGVALRTGEPLLMRNLAEIGARFPGLYDVYPTERSLHVAPLIVSGHRLGVLSLTFPGGGVIDEETQVSFVNALADACAQALERTEATREAAEANERLAFLAEASVLLSQSLDYRDTVTAVAKLLVPRLADWCVIQVVEAGTLANLALVHFDEAKLQWAESLQGRYPTDMQATTGAPNVIRTGVSEVYPYLPDELLEDAATDEEHLEILRRLGMSSAIVVPLTGRTGTFGAITLIHAESGRRYSAADMPFVEDVARRVAIAVETAHAFREQSGRLAEVRQVAEAAQLAILSPPPAQIGPVALAARYVSAAAEALIGGDLYEVVARPGSVRLLIGDVRGKGLSAVRTATIVLGEFRAAASDVDDLVDVAVQIDRRLRPYLAEEDFVTALIAEIADDGGFTVVSCGHPPALLASDGRIVEVQTPATVPIGLGVTPQPVRGRLAAGDRLLLYTDGVIEARGHDRQFVDLMRLVAPLATAGVETVLDQVLGALRTTVGEDLGDDLAMLVAEYRGAPAGPEPSGRVVSQRGDEISAPPIVR